MRLLAAAAAAGAAWTVAGGALPTMPRLELPPFRAALAGGAVGTVLGSVSLGLTGSPMIGLAISILAVALAMGAGVERRRRDREADLDRWPEVLAIMQGHLAGGSALPEALIDALLAAGEPFADVGHELSGITRFGWSFDDALDAVEEQLAAPVTDEVVALLRLAHRGGGAGVSAQLGDLAVAIAESVRLRQAHRAALAQQRATAAVALVAPWALLVLTAATNPQATEVYRTATGGRIVAFGLGASLIGHWLTRRTAALRRAKRVFR